MKVDATGTPFRVAGSTNVLVRVHEDTDIRMADGWIQRNEVQIRVFVPLGEGEVVTGM